MPYTYLTVDEPAAGVVCCTLSNPPTHTLVAAELAEIVDFTATMDARDDVRAVVFTGGGKGIFIRHYEVGELADSAARAAASAQDRAQTDAPGNGGALHRFNQLTIDMQRAPYITIAAINGSAAGGGLEFALGCDFRLMADGDYRIGLPETGVGIIPGAGGTQRFARLLGVAKALELILHGTLLTPREGLALGLLHEVYPSDEFPQRVLDYASRLAGRSPIAIAAAKAAIYRGMDTDIEAGLCMEQAQFARCMRSRDAAVAMRGVLNGDNWTWEGR